MSKKSKFKDSDVLGPAYDDELSDEVLSGEMPEEDEFMNLEMLGVAPEEIKDPKFRKKYVKYLGKKRAA